MDRFWFFTWRTYGTWLPGQEGFVGNYRTIRGQRQIDNRVGELATEGMPPLADYARKLLANPPIMLTLEQAGVVLIELLRICEFRGWQARAIAILADHVHFVFGVPGDPTPSDLLREIKSYTSRALNRSAPQEQSWWVTGGSTRPVKGEASLCAVIKYVRAQDSPLVQWLSGEAQRLIG
jgi:REP element-mobilizing transposase RayT